MQHTSAFQLNQWEEDDPILRSDFNSDNLKIADALANCGNCRIAIGSYVGTGTSGSANPCKISLGFRPYVIMLDTATHYRYNNAELPYHYIMQYPGTTLAGYDPSRNYNNVITWGDDGVTWYTLSTNSDAEYRAIHQFNYSGKTYHYIAFGI